MVLEVQHHHIRNVNVRGHTHTTKSPTHNVGLAHAHPNYALTTTEGYQRDYSPTHSLYRRWLPLETYLTIVHVNIIKTKRVTDSLEDWFGIYSKQFGDHSKNNIILLCNCGAGLCACYKCW